MRFQHQLILSASLVAMKVATPFAVGHQARSQYPTSLSNNNITFVPLDIGAAHIIESQPNAADLDPATHLISPAGFVEPALQFCLASISTIAMQNAQAAKLLPNATAFFIYGGSAPTSVAGPAPNGGVAVALAPKPLVTKLFGTVSGHQTLVPSMVKAMEPFLDGAVALASGVPGGAAAAPLISQLLLGTDTQPMIFPTKAYSTAIPTHLPTFTGKFTLVTPSGTY